MNQKAYGDLELIEMQKDQALQLKYKSKPITEIWKFVPESKYPELKNAACRIILIFGTTFLCESFYSTLKFVKYKHRSVLTNQYLEELLRSAVTNYSPNFKELLREVK
ncbi:general transcription factor II-I repeat domain-containing protein 2 [Trichonephila inaurata madagascariensis]|uniref:General transcription factor II-I repeat domain-containing protein 2 n=1 Tax=Trichonephila inaurata madagascariensis TaxID=2747483 RepID=A0A8X6IV83_9ARAC|nr:general transcription factor II-I repeat domain-containing protein 2 [Trichonephila inaurata madagascariensis]